MYGRSYDYHMSCMLSGNCANLTDRSLGLRAAFMETEVMFVSAVKGHTHGSSAASRTSASLFMEQVAQVTGSRPVFYQGSAADARNQRCLTREWRWIKDVNAEPKLVHKERDDVVIMVDVDYYLDMPRFLGEHFRPTMMYTFQPSAVARADKEYKYYFNNRNEVCYFVSGGGKYQHQVWNYDGDSVSAVRRFCGIPITFSTFSLERRMIDDDHQVVLLSPMRKFRGVYAWLAMRRMGQSPLQRLQVVKDGFSRLRVDSSKGVMMSTGCVGGFLSCTIPVEQDEAIGAIKRTMKQSLSLAGVKSIVSANGVEKILGVEVLHEYWLKTDLNFYGTVRVLEEGVRGYQYMEKPEQLDLDAKEGMVAFMHPILNGSFVPQQTRGNDRAGIQNRVEIPQKNTRSVVMSAHIKRCIDEWIAHKDRFLECPLHPVDEDEVWDKQKKPTQRNILLRADYEPEKHVLSAFGKRESYGKVNYQRNITTLPGKEKKSYSRYMYAYTDFIKKMPWYAFGDKPNETAHKVSQVAQSSKHHLLITDYTTFDGTINAVFRAKRQMEVLHAFHSQYSVELGELLRKQRNRTARTRFGVVYNSGDSVLSGSPETSVMNTDDNAFVSYCSLRASTDHNGQFLTPMEAWNRLGLYGGDDGIVADVEAKIAERTAKQLGLQLKCERIKRGKTGVMFLSRCYGPDVWFGNPNSICSVKRILSKFHTTVAMPSNITPAKKLFEKAYALSLTDSHTPIVGLFVKRVIALFNSMTYENSLGIWNGDVAQELHYPNEYGDWMDDIVVNDIPTFDFAAFVQWIENADTTTIFNPPVFDATVDPNPKPGVVSVDGDIREVLPTIVEETTPKRARPRARKPKSQRPSRLVSPQLRKDAPGKVKT